MPTLKSLTLLMLCLLFALLPQHGVLASPALQTGPFTTTTSISASPNPAFVDQSVTLTVTVTAAGAGAGTPFGLVIFSSSQATLCSAALDAAGQATCTLSYDTPRSIPVKAVYQGANSYLPSTAADITLTIIPRYATTVTITSHDPNPSLLMQTVNMQVTVASAGPVPTGTVTVYRSSGACANPAPPAPADGCTFTLAGGAGSCARPLSQAGAWNLCAIYNGDAANLPGTGSVEHYVSASNNALGIQSAAPAPSLLGEPVWIHFTLTALVATPPPSGIVTVTSGVESCTGTLAAGGCWMTFHLPGWQAVVASYPGDASTIPPLEASTSNTWMQRVNAPPSDIQLSKSTISAMTPLDGLVGTLSTTDPNTDESHVYTLVSGTGSDNNNSFRIDGDNLRLALKTPPSGSLSIRVRSTDPADLFVERVFRLRIISAALPATGFAPGRITRLPAQPAAAAYRTLDALALEIPALRVSAEIVGVPWSENGWDASWLGQSAGWLDGTAFPSWQGNSVLVGHNALQDGTPGPFANLASLKWGDSVLVRAYGSLFTYEVRSVERVIPQDASRLRHEDKAWITLITCQNFDEDLQAYRARVVARAVLVNVEPDEDAGQ